MKYNIWDIFANGTLKLTVWELSIDELYKEAPYMKTKHFLNK